MLKEERILEYRVHKGVKCMLVQWNDGTTTWTRVANLSDRSMIRRFIRQCIEILYSKKKKEELQKQKEMENALLEKILSKNTNKSQITNEVEHKKMLIKEICQRDAGLLRPEIFAGMRKYQPATAKAGSPSRTAQQVKLEPKNVPQQPNLVFKPSIQSNVCHIKYKNRPICDMTFCLDRSLEALNMDLETCIFVQKNVLFTQLYYFLRFQPEKIQAVPANISRLHATAESEALNNALKHDQLILIFREGKHIYLLLDTAANSPIPFDSNDQTFIMRLEPVKIFTTLFRIINTQSGTLLWDDGTYRSAVVSESSCIFDKIDVLSGRPIFIIDDGSSMVKHAINAVKQRATVVADITQSVDLLLPSTLYDYIHQLPDIDQLVLEKRRVYGIIRFGIAELLRNAYVFLVTDNFITKCKLKQFLLFSVGILEKRAGIFLFEPEAYRTLVRRSGGAQEEEQFKPNKIVAVLKNCIYTRATTNFYKEVKDEFKILFRNIVLLDEDNYEKYLTMIPPL